MGAASEMCKHQATSWCGKTKDSRGHFSLEHAITESCDRLWSVCGDLTGLRVLRGSLKDTSCHCNELVSVTFRTFYNLVGLYLTFTLCGKYANMCADAFESYRKRQLYPPFTPTNLRFFLAPLAPCLSAAPFFFIIDLRPAE